MLLLGILGGGVTSGSPNPDRPKNGIFHTRFQTWPLDRSYVIITEIRAQTKNSSNAFRIRIFLFRSYLFGIETTTTFIRSRSFLKNHTRFQTKKGQKS